MKLQDDKFNRYRDKVEIDEVVCRMKFAFLNALEKDIVNFTDAFITAKYVDHYVNGFLEGYISSTKGLNKEQLDYLDDMSEEAKCNLTEIVEGLFYHEE